MWNIILSFAIKFLRPSQETSTFWKRISIKVGFEQVSYKNQCMPSLNVDWAGPIPRPGTQASLSVARSHWRELTNIFQKFEVIFDWNFKIICLPSFLLLTYWIIFHLKVEHFRITQFSFCPVQLYFLVSSIPGFEEPYFLSSKDQIITAWYLLIQCRKKQNWRKK